jgi:hypothetical protein
MATHADAELILHLYELRREEVCRNARKFLISWQPQTDADIAKVCNDMTTQENAWFRQAVSYWEMAFSIANSGALDADLFAKNCGEGIIYSLKCAHLRRKFSGVFVRTMPEADAFIAKSKIAQDKAEMFKARLFPSEAAAKN